MDKVILVIGILVVLEGIMFMVRPDWLKKTMQFFLKGKMLYIGAVLRIVLGVVFLVSATSCPQMWVVIALGILFCGAGIGMFLIKLDKLKGLVNWFLQRSLITLRLMMIAAVALGGLIIWTAV